MTFVKIRRFSDVEMRRPQMLRFFLLLMMFVKDTKISDVKIFVVKDPLSLIDATKIQHPDFPLIRFYTFRAFLCLSIR